jgi:ribonuclease J
MLKIIPLGEVGTTVTKNMFVYELEDELIIVDCGIGFPEDSMYGVDVLIPDITSLQESKKKILGMILSHGHDDHIAALPYIIPKLPDFPIFASKLTGAFAQERMNEFGIQKRVEVLDDNRGIRLGNFAIESIKMTHSVPDTRHLIITSPEATIYHGSDFKIDLTPVDGVKPELQKIAMAGDRNIDILLSDCLRSEQKGFSLSESSVYDTIQTAIRNAKGKVIVTVMSSHIHRIQQIVNAAAEVKKKIAFFGRSVEQNTRVAQELGFLKISDQVIVKRNRINRIPDNELCLIVAGSQGQTGSALVRAAQGEHEKIEIKAGDTVIFSADPIPGNEKAVYETVDSFAQKGAEVLYSDSVDNLHVSGHGSAGDLMLLMELVKPRYLMPIGGNYRHMVQYQKLAQQMGNKKENILLLNAGDTIEINENKQVKIGEKIILKNIMVDGLGIGDVGRVVLRDRKLMAEEGILVVIIPIDERQVKLIGEIEIISRGLVYEKQAQDLINRVKSDLNNLINNLTPPVTDWNSVKNKIRMRVEELLSEELERFPIIIPLIMRM